MLRTIRPFQLVLCILALLFAASLARAATELPNVAIKKTASATSSEDAHPPEDAVDGDEGTRWCNNGADTGVWWKVDLGTAQSLGGCEIMWEHDGARYQYVIEGSTDDKTWKVLNDQRGSQQTAQTQKLALAGDASRYVRITITGLDEGSWASFFEFKLHSAADMKKLTPAEAKAFLASAPLHANLALNKKATASTEQDGHPAGDAVDGTASTRWCAEDDTTPQWWKVDLGAAQDFATVEIRWEQEKNYKFIVEGSTDDKEWKTLSDQKQNNDSKQVQSLAVTAKGVRYIRITVTGLEDGVWASISEVTVQGTK